MSVSPKDHAAVTMLVNDIQALESRAHRLGLSYTARGLNRAKNAAGWELAGENQHAARSVRGEHIDA